ncbi:MAG: SspB family protein [Candidatus Paracaedibacter sp.]
MSKIIKFDYEQLVQESLRSVVRESLMQVARSGLPGNHHFYISFRTDYPGVDLPDYLLEQYPEEITIVLQYEFWDLEVEEDSFFVTLCFNDIHERLTIPLQAIVSFVDPSVKFGLQFSPTIHEKAIPQKLPVKQKLKSKAKTKANPLVPPTEEGQNGSNVVILDAFRKK